MTTEDPSAAAESDDEYDSFLQRLAAAPSPMLPSPRLPPGTIVDGTFRVESVLGAGAMGVVYLAEDLVLDRRVALKLHGSGERDVRRSRMWREAKSLARLADPNVIAVHEVGVFDDRVYIAMELVEGGTAAQWLATARTWREVVEVFVQAARGLAAAHRVGLVHRDFKATNILVGNDGRVRVADFGLARAAGDDPDPTSSSDDRAPSSIDERLTATGAAVGTPAYMAPEQREGKVDQRADQYSFCVALHEALYGVRPFIGGSTAEIHAAMIAGDVRPVPPGRDVPSWLRAVVLRGLRPLPDDRFPDMDTVVVALQSDPTRRRRTRIAIATAGSAIVGLAGLAGYLGTRDRSAIDCSDRAVLLGDAWNDERRATVGEGILASGVAYAADTRARVETGIDAYADTWMASASAACERSGAPLTDALRNAQALCLEHRKLALHSLVDVLEHADARAVERAVTAVGNLPSVAPCSDVAWISKAVAPPDDPAVAAQVETIRASLARAFALEQAGSFGEATALADAALADARSLAYPPLVAEASTRVGHLADANGKYDVAETTLREAYADAIANADDELAAVAATRLTHVVGHQLARHEDGLEWGFHAMAAVRRLGLGDRREATLRTHLAAIHQVRGEYDQAFAEHSRALEIFETSLGAEHLEVARTLSNLAGIRRLQGDYADSIERFHRALALRERALGPDHPAVAHVLHGLSAAHFEAGDHRSAIATARRALAIRERALGPNHPDVAAVLANLGAFLQRTGDYEAALAVLERAEAIDRRALGPDHPSLAITIENIGNLHQARGDYTLAVERYRVALDIRERALGPEHPHVAMTLNNLGLALDGLEKHDESLAMQQRALAILEKSLGADHPSIATTHDTIGQVLLGLGRLDQAEAHYRRGLEIRRASSESDVHAMSLSLINLGNVLEVRGDYTAALDHHTRALAMIEADVAPRWRALAEFNVGQALAGLGRRDAAAESFARALAIRERNDTPPNELADTRFELAKSLPEDARARAIALAEEALAGYVPGTGTQSQRDAVAAWLAAHPSSSRGR